VLGSRRQGDGHRTALPGAVTRPDMPGWPLPLLSAHTLTRLSLEWATAA
jgi:hypothetical protein